MGKRALKVYSCITDVCDSDQDGQVFLTGYGHFVPDHYLDCLSGGFLVSTNAGEVNFQHVIDSASFDHAAQFVCAVKDPAGVIYIAEDEVFNIFQDGQLGQVKVHDHLDLKGAIKAAYVRGAGSVCFCTNQAEVIHLHEGTLDLMKVGKSRFDMLTQSLNSIHGVGSDFMVVVGNNGGVGVFRNGKWEKIRTPTINALGGVYCKTTREIYMTEWDGRAWLWDGGDQWQPIEYHLLPSEYPVSVSHLCEYQGCIYAAAAHHGILKFEDNRFVQIPDLDEAKHGKPRVTKLSSTTLGLFGVGTTVGETSDWLVHFDGTCWKTHRVDLGLKPVPY